MTHQEATSVFNVPVEQVYTRLADVTQWPQFLVGVQSVRTVAHERYVFTVHGDGDSTREVEVAVGHHPGEQRIAWHALAGPRFDGELRLVPTGVDHTRVHLTLTVEPAGFLANLTEMAGGTVPAAALDLQRLERHLLTATG